MEDTIYILSYGDAMYPEDNRIIGAYRTEKAAEEARDSEISAWASSHGGGNHHTMPYRYQITSMVLT